MEIYRASDFKENQTISLEDLNLEQPEEDSLCWYCKRNPAYGVYKNQEDHEPYHHTCPWMELGKHVKGWKAEKGVPIYSQHPDHPGVISHGYAVKECPMYERGFQQTTYFEYLDMVQKATGLSYGAVHQATERSLKKFEKMFNTKVPAWVWVEYYFKQWSKGKEIPDID